MMKDTTGKSDQGLGNKDKKLMKNMLFYNY